jgi:hypothetical protein
MGTTDREIGDSDQGGVLPLVMMQATRFRFSYAQETPDGWVVRLSGEQRVLPKDVSPLGGIRELNDAGREIPPLRLQTTSQAAFDSLLRVALLDDPAAAAKALAAHCREHPSNLRLCSAHGLPYRHQSPQPVPDFIGACRTSRELLSVVHVVGMMNGLMGVEDLAHGVAVQRTPRSREEVARALQWDLLGDLAESYNKQFSPAATLSVVLCKRLIRDYLEEFHRSAGSDYGYRWLPQHGLRLVNHAGTDLALYVAAFASRTLNAVRISDKPLALACLNCERTFKPRNSIQQFCGEAACRRAHAARNRQRERRSKLIRGEQQ